MNLYDYNTINKILSSHGFTFSKALGQNFLIDSSVCPRMAESLGADEKTGVIEVGPGIGVLTKELSKVCGRVVSIELDKRLPAVLAETLKDCPNVNIVEGDVMKLDLEKLINEYFSDMTSVKVCANLPYYITSPVIMTLLESKINIDEIVVMVQKEAAQRLCAEVGTRDSGAVTVAVRYYAEPEVLFSVDRSSFYPSPNVDSAVIKLSLRKEPAVPLKDEKTFFSVVKCGFAQRRKTLLNSLANTMGIKKQIVSEAMKEAQLPENIRMEKLTMEQLALLSDIIFEMKSGE